MTSNVQLTTLSNTVLAARVDASTPATPPDKGPKKHGDRPWRDRAADACLKTATTLAAALGIAHPATAYADIDVSGTLTQVLNMLSNGIVLLGGILVVMGLVNLGMSLKDGMRGGSELSGALAMIVGGIVVSAAGAYFRTLPTNIAG